MKSTERKSYTVLACWFVFVMTFASDKALAQAGSWFETGSMSVPRRDHTATLLTNGRVLIVGWITNLTELYDPTTGTFSVAGNSLFGHAQGSTATRLADGRILIVGGMDVLQETAEIYDPLSGTFSPTTSNPNAVHSYHSATLLPDGRVLIAGGQEQAGPQTHSVAELYDPITGAFTLTDSLNTHRSLHTATLLSNGKVLIAGGLQTTTPGYGIGLSSAELYDPSTGTFSATGSMSRQQLDHRATLLRDGKVLITGGWSGPAEIYDPDTGIFTLAGNKTIDRRSYTATLLPNGQVLIAGGYVATGPVTTNSAQLYDPTTGTFSATGSMKSARMQHTATLLTSGQVLVTGGYDGTTETSSAELYTPARMAIDKTDLAFVADSGWTSPASQTVSISNAGGGTLIWEITKTQPWLQISPVSGVTAQNSSSAVTVSINTTGLLPGTYRDSILVASTNALNSPQKIDVTYEVTPLARIIVSVESLTFAADSNNAIPPVQIFTLTNSGAGTLRWQVRKSTPWLSVNPDTGTGNSAEITVAILTTDLPPGTHRDTLEITGVKLETGSSALNSPHRVVVTFAVGAQARIGLDRGVISFLGDSAAAIPPTQSFRITNAGGGTLQWRATKRQPWLSIGPSDGTSNSATITVGVLTTDLLPGTFQDTIEVTGSKLETGRTAVNSPRFIAVTYLVGARARLALDKTVLAFGADSGAVVPTAQTLAITNTGAGTLRWVVTKSAPWLSVSPDTGTSNSAAVTVAIVQTALTPGTYEDTVRVTAAKAETGSSALDSPQGVVVTFTVEPRANLLVNRTTISFTADSGAVVPPAELFSISNIGGGTLRWSVGKTQPWLIVTPDAGTTNSDTITVGILTTDLAAGTYRDTLRVLGEKVETGTSAVGSPQPIEVTYRVFALPRIVLDRREIEFVADSAAVLPQPEQFVLTNGGDYTLEWSVSKTQPWLDVGPTSGISNRDTIGLQVTTTNLAPGTYLDTVRITSTNAINSPQYLVVTYRVIENGPPRVFALISPSEGDTLQLVYPAAPVLFRWRASTDPDAGDVIRYSAFLTGTGFDTTLSQLNDTTVVLDIMERLTMRTAYRWWVQATDGVLTTSSDTAQFVTSSTVTDVDPQASYIPNSYALYQNYPNPFNPSTTIRYDLPKQARVSLKVYDLLGREVEVLVDEEHEPGRYQTAWWPIGISTGIYFYRLTAGEFVETRRLMLVK